jgi:hypothetical protein
MFVIVTSSFKQKGVSLFLIDRTKTKRSWWDTTLNNDILYMRNIRAANRICRKLKHNNPRVITVERARKLAKENENIRNVINMFDDHPFTAGPSD